MPDSLPPIQVTQQAAEGQVKGVADDLNVSLTTVYKMLSDEGYDPYGRFLAFYRSIAKRNPDGAEMLFQDFKARHYALKDGSVIKGGNRDEMLGDALNIMADAVRCRENSAMFQLKAARVIRVLEWLLIERSQ